MPKKFAAENTKAVAARERKKAAKDAETSKKQKAEEDALWQDDDKQLKKRQQKKEEMEKKREQQLAKKQEAKALLEKEMSSIKSSKPAPPTKLTRTQISNQLAAKEKEKINATEKQSKVVTHLDIPLEENINKLKIEGEEARSIDEAIEILTDKADTVDKHPEKRRKAAYTAYEQRRLAELKIENPSLKLSQLKQIIFKEWQKSPENPLNNL